jgi:hypothetical protein
MTMFQLNDFSLAKLGRFAAIGLIGAALAACGGGGGSPGTVSGGGGTSGPTAPASITLLTSADTIAASGVDGTEVTLTAIVKDSNNNAVVGTKVNFQADSGSISNTVRLTDNTGAVSEKLSVKGDPRARVITITATAGNATSAAKTVTVQASSAGAPKLLLTSSKGALASSGAAGSEVTILALLLDANNVVMPGATVSFAADSGALSASKVVSDAGGQASVKLATGTDPSTRAITVSASVPGVPGSTVKVNVVGTKLSISAASTVNLGATSDVTVALVDSAGVPLANKAIAFSAASNALATKSGASGSALTDSLGRLALSYSATKGIDDVITVRALGETASAAIAISVSNFSVSVVDASGAVLASADTGTCNRVAVSNFVGSTAQGGTVGVSASRGTVYSDAACGTALTSDIALVAGLATAYVKATGPGLSTLTASSSATKASVQSVVEFVTPLNANAVINLQAAPAVIGANRVGSTTEQTTLRAVVRDSASRGNPIKNAKIAFSIVTDSSGGSLSQPSELLTDSDGVATINYIAGTTSTAFDGVVIQARIQSAVTNALTTVKLTVAQKALFISAGTGNTIVTPNSTTYQVDYVVFVTDAAGNAVRDASVTGAVIPRRYYKGRMVFVPPGPWAPVYSVVCPNEDVDRDGVLGPNEDANGNGRLDPVIPMAITSSGKTDASGTAIISLTYPRDRAFWMDVDFTIRGAVAGSEASYVGYTVLPGLASDYISATVAPPGLVSPYGQSSTCSDDK